jgi:hypothetical protein
MFEEAEFSISHDISFTLIYGEPVMECGMHDYHDYKGKFSFIVQRSMFYKVQRIKNKMTRFYLLRVYAYLVLPLEVIGRFGYEKLIFTLILLYLLSYLVKSRKIFSIFCRKLIIHCIWLRNACLRGVKI